MWPISILFNFLQAYEKCAGFTFHRSDGFTVVTKSRRAFAKKRSCNIWNSSMLIAVNCTKWAIFLRGVGRGGEIDWQLDMLSIEQYWVMRMLSQIFISTSRYWCDYTHVSVIYPSHFVPVGYVLSSNGCYHFSTLVRYFQYSLSSLCQFRVRYQPWR